MAAPVPRPVPVPAPIGAAPTAQPVNRPAPVARTAAAPAVTVKASKLGDVKRGTLPTSKRIVVYGLRGIGKSSLAADAPKPIFIDLGNATEHLDVARYPLPEEPSYQDILDAIDDLSGSDHDYKTLVIEDMGEMESLLWKHIIAATPPNRDGERPTNIEGFGFGKGYTIAAGEWRVLVQRLDRLRLRKGMHVIMLGHSVLATVKNPTGENYDQHVPLIHLKAVGVIGASADVVAFATFDDVAKRIDAGPMKGKKVIGVTGHRVLHLEYSASWDAKCRLPMPAMIDLKEVNPWGPFEEAIERLKSLSPATLREQIEAELARVGDPFTLADGYQGSAEKVRAAVAGAGDDVPTLFKYLTGLQQAQPITVNAETSP
jgi:hypothetical protein